MGDVEAVLRGRLASLSMEQKTRLLTGADFCGTLVATPDLPSDDLIPRYRAMDQRRAIKTLLRP
jgi:hypothetical protein